MKYPEYSWMSEKTINRLSGKKVNQNIKKESVTTTKESAKAKFLRAINGTAKH